MDKKESAVAACDLCASAYCKFVLCHFGFADLCETLRCYFLGDWSLCCSVGDTWDSSQVLA